MIKFISLTVRYNHIKSTMKTVLLKISLGTILQIAFGELFLRKNHFILEAFNVNIPKISSFSIDFNFLLTKKCSKFPESKIHLLMDESGPK